MQLQLNRNKLSLVIAVILGVVTVVLLNVYLAKKESLLQKEEEGQQVAVVFATKDIPRGTKITAAMVKMGSVKETQLVPRAITSRAGAIDKVSIADIISGEQVSYTKLMSATAGLRQERTSSVSYSNLAMKIPAGKRAFTIALDEISAGGGMIRPNDYVDLMGMFPFAEQRGTQAVTQNVSVTLFQNILVLAVGQDLSTEPDASGKKTRGSSTVTLALTPQQVELLHFAQNLGKIRLVVRPPLETTVQSIPPVTADVLWQQILTQAGMSLPSPEATKEIPRQEKTTQTVEIFRGQEKEVVPLN